MQPNNYVQTKSSKPKVSFNEIAVEYHGKYMKLSPQYVHLKDVECLQPASQFSAFFDDKMDVDEVDCELPREPFFLVQMDTS